MELLFWLGFCLPLAALVFTASGALAALGFYRRESLREEERASCRDGISVLKPLKGVDAETARNLESFFWQNHPRYELLFCVADESDPVIPLVRGLMREHADVNARLFIDGTEIGPNPKINNVRSGYRAARFDAVLISDSNIRVEPEYLQEMAVGFLGRDLICSVVSGRNAGNFTGGVESIFLGGFYARPMILMGRLGKPCVMGKSMMLSRRVLDSLGGLESLAPYLAEDFIAGDKFRRAGRSVAYSRFPVVQVVGSPSFRSFWSRHLRWGRIRKTHAPLVFLVEPLMTNSLVAAAFLALAAEKAGFAAIPFFTGFLSLWFALDYAAIRASGTRLGWRTPLLWLARELLHVPLWAHIAVSNHIVWKGKSWRMDGEGKLVSDDPTPHHAPEDQGVAARGTVAREMDPPPPSMRH